MSASGIRRARWVHRCSTLLALVLAGAIPTTASNAQGATDASSAVDSQRRSVTSSAVRLGDVYREVRDRNPKAAAAHALADAAGSRISGAKLPPDPQVQLSFMNYGLPGLRPMDPTGMVAFQLTQMLPTPGKLGLAGSIAESRASAERERALDVDWSIRQQAASAFYDLYEAEQSMAIAIETRRLIQDIERIAATMYEVGEGRQTDVLRAQVEMARMTEEIDRMAAMRAAAAARLNALFDRDAGALVPSALLPAFPDTVISADSLIGMATRDRPMVRAGEDELRAAGEMERLAHRELFPDLMIGVQYGQRGSSMGTERMGSLMLGASVPIFASRRQIRLREEAAAMRTMAEADLRYMRAETKGQVGEACAMLNRARRLERLYLHTVIPQAEAAAAAALAAYRVGEVDFMTLLDNRMTVNGYRMELAELQAGEGRAWAELEMLVGRELFDPNTVSLASTSDRRGNHE